MQNKNSKLFFLIPHVSQRYLLYIASVVWFFAGGMLLYRGLMGIKLQPEFLMLKIIIAFIFGVLFYNLIFKKISQKYINRIEELTKERNPFYAFFNLRGYVMMTFMISMGITIRLTGLVPFEYLALFYIVMGTPLLFSALRFFYSGIAFKRNA